MRDQQLVNVKTGEQFTVEFLAEDPSFERVFLFYKPSLDRLGMNVTVRTVDEAQFENRLRSWDFDIITMAWSEIALARQRAARLLGLAGRRPARLAEHGRHQKSGGRRHDRSDRLCQEPRPISKPPPARSTASCCGTFTSCRNGATARCVPRAGTASAIPIRCRNTAGRLSRRCGGGTPQKRPRRRDDVPSSPPLVGRG